MSRTPKRPLRFAIGWTARREFKRDRGGKWFLRSRHGRIIDRDTDLKTMLDRHPECNRVDPSSGPLVKLGNMLDGQF